MKHRINPNSIQLFAYGSSLKIIYKRVNSLNMTETCSVWNFRGAHGFLTLYYFRSWVVEVVLRSGLGHVTSDSRVLVGNKMQKREVFSEEELTASTKNEQVHNRSPFLTSKDMFDRPFVNVAIIYTRIALMGARFPISLSWYVITALLFI